MTKPTQLRKNNHYVPQLYLKQWMTNGKIPTYRLLVPNEGVHLWKDHSLKGIAYHQHLYTYLVGQEETDEFERWLSNEFEAPAEEAIHLAINDERMSQEHWKKLIRFAVAQDVRGDVQLRRDPRQRAHGAPGLGDIGQRVVDHDVENYVRVYLMKPCKPWCNDSSCSDPKRVDAKRAANLSCCLTDFSDSICHLAKQRRYAPI